MRLLKDNRLLLLLIIIIAFIFATSGRVLGFELHLNGDEVAHAWELQPSGDGTWFCIDSSRSLRFIDSFGNKSSALEYTNSGETVTISPQLAYTLYYIKASGGNVQDYADQIQKLVWGSVGDPKGSNEIPGNIGARATQYYTEYNEIFSKIGNKQLFMTSSKESDLKVLVDQIDGTYTVGPYYLNLNISASKNTKQILYNEIVGKGNQGFSSKTRFAQWSGKVTGVNGTNVVMVDSNGNQISFPDFVNNKPFYIRFKPDNNGAIGDIGQPVINVRYIKQITFTASSSTSSSTTIPTITLPIFKCTNIVIPEYAFCVIDDEDNRILDIKEITKNVGKYTIRSSNGYKMVYTYEVKADVLGVVDMR